VGGAGNGFADQAGILAKDFQLAAIWIDFLIVDF
jgi:hypothetical protein